MPRLATRTAVALAAGLALAPGASGHEPASTVVVGGAVEAHDPADCRCRAQGRLFALGERACLPTGDGPRLAECGMVLNNTAWRVTARPCPDS